MNRLVLVLIVIAFLAVGYEIHGQQNTPRPARPRVVGQFNPGERWPRTLYAIDDTLRRITCYRGASASEPISCAPWGTTR